MVPPEQLPLVLGVSEEASPRALVAWTPCLDNQAPHILNGVQVWRTSRPWQEFNLVAPLLKPPLDHSGRMDGTVILESTGKIDIDYGNI